MKLKVLNFFVFIFISILLISCDKAVEGKNENNECIKYEIAYVSSVNAPATGAVNETIDIEVNFGVYNGCGGFEKFIENENVNVRTIKVQAKYDDCSFCSAMPSTRTIHYHFTAKNAGDYVLKFKSGPTEFITVNLTIN